MRSFIHLVVGALAIAAPLLVTSTASALIEPEPCGELDISADAQCELLAGATCVAKCDPVNLTAACDGHCAITCADDVGCVATCAAQCTLDLDVACEASCAADGALFCDGQFVYATELQTCLDYLCSVGQEVAGVACGGDDCPDEPEDPPAPPDDEPDCLIDPCDPEPEPDPDPTPDCLIDPCPPDDDDPPKAAPVARTASAAELAAQRANATACSATPGSAGHDGAALFVAVAGLGLLVARRRRG